MNTDTLPDSDTFRVVYQSAAKSKGKGEREVSIPSFKCVVLYFDSLLHEVYRNMIISDLGQLSLLLSDKLVGRSAIVLVSWASR